MALHRLPSCFEECSVMHLRPSRADFKSISSFASFNDQSRNCSTQRYSRWEKRWHVFSIANRANSRTEYSWWRVRASVQQSRTSYSSGSSVVSSETTLKPASTFSQSQSKSARPRFKELSWTRVWRQVDYSSVVSTARPLAKSSLARLDSMCRNICMILIEVACQQWGRSLVMALSPNKSKSSSLFERCCQ